mgnify:CR=1 FL=1
MKNQKLNAIANKAAADFLQLVKDSEDNLLDAWAAAESDASDNDTTAKFRFGISVTLDLGGNTMDTALSFGVKRKASIVGEIPDPNQIPLALPSEESTMTIVTEGVPPVTLTASQLKKAAKKLGKK